MSAREYDGDNGSVSSSSEEEEKVADEEEEEETQPQDKRNKNKRGNSSSGKHKHKGGETCPRTTKAVVKRNLPLLNVLSRITDEERSCLLKHLDVEALNVLSCCIWNVLHNHDIVPAPARKTIAKKLKNQREHLHYVSKQANDPKKRKRFLIQQGGSLPLLLSAVLPCIREAQ